MAPWGRRETKQEEREVLGGGGGHDDFGEPEREGAGHLDSPPLLYCPFALPLHEMPSDREGQASAHGSWYQRSQLAQSGPFHCLVF